MEKISNRFKYKHNINRAYEEIMVVVYVCGGDSCFISILI